MLLWLANSCFCKEEEREEEEKKGYLRRHEIENARFRYSSLNDHSKKMKNKQKNNLLVFLGTKVLIK